MSNLIVKIGHTFDNKTVFSWVSDGLVSRLKCYAMQFATDFLQVQIS